MTLQKLNKLINRFSFIKQPHYIKSAYTDPVQMKEIVKIGRIVQNKSENGKIELIRAGLLQMIQKMIEKTVSKDERQGEIIYINQKILKFLMYYSDLKSIIINETYFLENYLQFINQLPPIKLQKEFLTPLETLAENLSVELNQKIFEKGIIQSLTKTFDSADQNIRQLSIEIIINLIKARIEELKEGQQHPYHQQLLLDGIIGKLIQQFKDEQNSNLKSEIALIFAYLFKAIPLPNEIKMQIIKEFKDKNIVEFVISAECTDNHEAILERNILNILFKYEYNLLNYLQLIYNLLKFGSYSNKKKVALAVKEKVEQLLINEYMDELVKNYYYDEQKIKKIKAKTQEVILMIKYVEEQIEEQGEFEEINDLEIQENQKNEENDNIYNYDYYSEFDDY